MDLTLTSKGKRMTRNLQARGASGQIIGLLDQNGAMSVEEIAQSLDVPERRVKSIANQMFKQDLIRPTGE